MKRFKLPRVRMKVALFVSVALLVLGMIVAVAGVFIYLAADKVIADFEPVADSYLSSAISMLQSTKNAIAAVEPSLASSSQIAEDATRALRELGTTATDFGNALNINIFGWRPFGGAADAILNIGSQVEGAISEIETVNATLTSITLEIENIKATLDGVQVNLENTREMLPTYFGQARLAVLLVTVGLSSFFGLVIGLGGSAILSLRREINKISDKIV
jgi:hypothetical protein